MTAVPPGLTVRDAQILELLRGGATRQRAASIGRYRRAWDAADVDRVIDQHIAHRSATHLVWRPQHYGGRARDVVLTPRLVEILDGLCTGASNAELARAAGVTEHTVKTQVKWLIRRLDADSRQHAVVLALTGRVRVLIPNHWKAA